MRGRRKDSGCISVVAPTVSAARAGARALARRSKDVGFVPFSLDRLIESPPVSIRVALCPTGTDVTADLHFLEEARARLLWPAPPPAIRTAIAGLLGDAIGATRTPPSRENRGSPALLLEGTVTRQRARHALESDARIWIVERAGDVRLSGKERERLARHGVRWFALNPVRVIAVIASPALARKRALWRGLLPARTPIWIVDWG